MKKHFIAIFILAIIMIVLPIQLRFAHKNPTLIGTEAYYHARMSTKIIDGIPNTDDAIQNGRPYVLEPYHLALAIGYRLLGPLAFNLLPALFALTSFIFFGLLLKTLKIPEQTQEWILLAYALSPPLIASATIGTPNAFVLTLILGGAWLLKTRAWPAGTGILFIASLSGIGYTISTIALLIILYLTQNNTKRIILAMIPSIFAFAIRYYPPKIEAQRGIIQYLSDLGGINGFSIFAVLLAIVGAILVWQYKKTYYGAYATALIFLATSFFLPETLVFANILISALAGIALAKLSERKWKLKFLREAALLVLFCGLLFSSISHAVNLSEMEPTPAFFKALEFPPGTVLTHQDYGFWVEIAGHTAVMDPLWQKTPDAQERIWDVMTMFKSAEIEKTNVLLKKYDITHILITPEMKKGLEWERELQGLDFLVENSETFKKLNTSSNIGVWNVT